MRYIAYLTGNPRIQGPQRREFMWRDDLQSYVFQNRTFDEIEFNSLVPGLLTKYRDYTPLIKIVEFDQPPTAEVIDAPAPEAQVPLTDEQAVENAEATLRKLAPHKLRKIGPPGTRAPASA